MDNKTPQQLDPKLKEAYDRVMGTVVTPPLKTPQPATPPLPEHQQSVSSVSPVSPTPAAQPEPEHEQTTPTPTTTVEAQPIIQKGVPLKKKGKVSPLIIFLGIIVFIAVYAIVWVKYFGLKVPYLNP